MGQSGSSKSTLTNVLGCLDRPNSGQYLVNGKDVSALTPDELASLRRDYFGFIFQRYNLLATSTASENIEIPAVYAGLPKQARSERAQQLLAKLGIGDRGDHRPNQLSGGQQQRLAIARAARLQQEPLQRNPGWAALQATTAPDGDADLAQADFARFDVPACRLCGGVLKPDVVFFGESVPRERVAAVREALSAADALLVAGSSLMVYSGYRFVEDAAAAGKPVAVVNRGRTRADAVLTLKVEKEVGEVLSALAARFRAPAPAP